MLHDFSDKLYWRRRWEDCYPYTYPPELFDFKHIHEERGWWIFKQISDYSVAVCARCGENISTGHYCKDLVVT